MGKSSKANTDWKTGNMTLAERERRIKADPHQTVLKRNSATVLSEVFRPR